MFVGIVAVAFLFLFITLPETKGLKLEEVQQLFEEGSCMCGKTVRRDDEVDVEEPKSSYSSTQL